MFFYVYVYLCPNEFLYIIDKSTEARECWTPGAGVAGSRELLYVGPLEELQGSEPPATSPAPSPSDCRRVSVPFQVCSTTWALAKPTLVFPSAVVDPRAYTSLAHALPLCRVPTLVHHLLPMPSFAIALTSSEEAVLVCYSVLMLHV